jgi:hypothetical protein
VDDTVNAQNHADLSTPGTPLLDLSWPPPDASPATQPDLTTPLPKRVFVTSTLYDANLGGLAGADAKCQERAAASGLGGIYKAWLSDANGNTPALRLTRSSGPYVLVTGVLLADNWNALTTRTLQHTIDTTELGVAAGAATTSACGATSVWTDSFEDGTLFSGTETCLDWTDATGVASSWGDWTSQVHWSSNCNGGNTAAIGCGSLNALYCFEQ